MVLENRSSRVPGESEFDPWALDAQYKPFPPFSEWVGVNSIDTNRWEHYSAQVLETRKAPPHLLRRALDVVKRAAAVETGAIEGLYDVDSGFTITVASQAAHWEQALAEKGDRARALIETQMSVYSHLLDLATQGVPISEAWIRELHRDLCGDQGTYSALTAFGLQELPLPLGEYKELPNHVIGRDGKPHAYAPVDMVPVEMHRLCEELRSEAFAAAHPVSQAAFAHYALVVVHPFADGNGRVARALGSVFTFRALSVPLLILAEHRPAYIHALEAADRGSRQPFIDFAALRTFDAIDLVRDSLEAAKAPSLEVAADRLRRLFATHAGYTHREIDEAGYTFQRLFLGEVEGQAQALQNGLLAIETILTDNPGARTSHSHRPPAHHARRTLHLSFSSPAPAQATVRRDLALEVPTNPSGDETVRMYEITEPNRRFEARITELLPSPAASLRLRTRVMVEGFLAQVLDDLVRQAEEGSMGEGGANPARY